MSSNNDSTFLYFFDEGLPKKLTNFDHSLTEFSAENKTSTSYNLNGTKVSYRTRKSPSFKQIDSLNAESQSPVNSSTQADLIPSPRIETPKPLINNSSKIPKRLLLFFGITLALVTLICIALLVLTISLFQKKIIK